jgi:SPP1 family predicted phage head-tail adaptor
MGRTYLAAAQEQAEVSHRVGIRYLSGIKPKIMRIVYGSRILEIKAVQDVDERNRELILMCNEYIDN